MSMVLAQGGYIQRENKRRHGMNGERVVAGLGKAMPAAGSPGMALALLWRVDG